MESREQVLKEGTVKPKDWIDRRLKIVTRQILGDGKAENWRHVAQGFREMAYLCARRGMIYTQFLALRKDVIEAIEVCNPMARTWIELQERALKMKTTVKNEANQWDD